MILLINLSCLSNPPTPPGVERVRVLRSRTLKDLYLYILLRAAHRPPQAATGRHRLPQAATGWKTFWPCQGVPSPPPPPDFTVFHRILEGSAAEAVACKPGIAAKRKAHWSCSALDGVFCSVFFSFFFMFSVFVCFVCLSPIPHSFRHLMSSHPIQISSQSLFDNF